MTRILLVDDDYLALNAFFSLTDWRARGYEIACEAKTGAEALDACARMDFDVAFLDVHLPDIDGIALMKRMREKKPDIACVMLSNYSDYPYVREAMKLGAKDYLLKHEIDAESLLTLLSQLGFPPLSGAADESDALLPALQGEPGREMRGQLLYARMNPRRELLSAARESILKTCRHILNARPGAKVCAPGEYELAAFWEDESAGEVARVMKTLLERYHNVTYDFAPPRAVCSRADVKRAYDALRERPAPEAEAPDGAEDADETALIFAILAGDEPEIRRRTEEALSRAMAEHTLGDYPRRMKRALEACAQGRAEAIPDAPTRAYQAGHWADAMLRAARELREARLRALSDTVRDAVSFIDARYSEPIDLASVAGACHVSYNHLSFQFKKETGQGVNSYLNRVRAHRAAMRMLLGDANAPREAGFQSYNHFFTVFKTVSGCAPSDFKKWPGARAWVLAFEPLG